MKKGRDKVVALFLSPASDKGRVTLRIGDNMWLYIPDVGRPIRITSLQSVTGSVFNNADILRIDYTAEYNVRRPKSKRTRICCRSRRRRAKSPTTGSRCGSTSRRCCRSPSRRYAASGLLLKTLRFKDIKDFGGGIKRPATLETDSPLYKGYKSVMLWSGLKKASFPDEISRSTICRGCKNCANEACRGELRAMVAAVLLSGRRRTHRRRKNTASTHRQFEKKPFELGGYVQLKQEDFRSTATAHSTNSQLRTSRSGTASTAPPERWNWSASCATGIGTFDFRTHSDIAARPDGA